MRRGILGEIDGTSAQDPNGDFKKARKIADLGQTALGAHQRACEVVGAPIPPAFRSEYAHRGQVGAS